jgi:alanine racemase
MQHSNPAGGSRAASLPHLVGPTAGPSFEQAGAVLTIDLGAVRENFRRLRRQLGGAACAGVVKADGYGLDADRIATALSAEGCRDFFVAHSVEGLSLRHALGPAPAIYVLNGIHPGAEDACAAAKLTAVVNSKSQLDAWRAAAKRHGKLLAVAVQVDSGMSRLGMSPTEVAALHAGDLDGLQLCLVMSHLACADDPSSEANEAQRLAFERLRHMLPPAPASLANSSGIFLGERYRYELARPGAALYGINPQPDRVNPMLPVVRLAAKVIQTRELPAGAGVGYGWALRTESPVRVATIALGYADGWPRRLSGAAWFEGVRLPFAGRVSMDSITLDVSSLPPGRPAPGELIELIGPHQDVDRVASLAGTIGYEILTGLGRRFHRRYEGSENAGPVPATEPGTA